MKESDVLSCQIQEWYPRFRNVSLRTKLEILPKNFVDHLLEDGLFLSRSSEAMPTRTVVTCPQLQSEDYDRWGEEDDDEGEPEVPSFPQLEENIRASIKQLGGSVFPKLNWSAPKDAAWISTTGNLKCQNFGEIILLLKASDSVSHDLGHAFDCCDDQTREKPDTVVLALRKWYDLRPEQEFRAFVFKGVLVGICQREVTGFYPSLVGKEDEFEFLIAEFFFETVRSRFPLNDYTFDCYMTKERAVKVVDFNPWAGYTLPLLFSWEELEENHVRVSAEMARISARVRDAAQVLEAVTLASHEDAGVTNGDNMSNGRTQASTGDESRVTPLEEDIFYGQEAYRVEMRIVTSEGLVRPGIRMATGIPIDFADRQNWENVISRGAAEEAERSAAAGA